MARDPIALADTDALQPAAVEQLVCGIAPDAQNSAHIVDGEKQGQILFLSGDGVMVLSVLILFLLR